MLDHIYKNYQFVVIRSFYELKDDPIAAALLPKVINLKISGYQKEYPTTVLPFDSSDFLATHLLLCRKDPTGLTPVLGFKSVSLDQCDRYRIKFPLLDMLKSPDDTTKHTEMINTMLDHYRHENLQHKVAYNGSFTIAPSLRRNKELMKYLWDITFSLLYNYYQDYHFETVLAVCATTFKVNVKKEKLGWKYIADNEDSLGPYRCHSLFGAELIPMILEDIKEAGKEPSQNFKQMWEEKLLLEKENKAAIAPVKVA